MKIPKERKHALDKFLPFEKGCSLLKGGAQDEKCPISVDLFGIFVYIYLSPISLKCPCQFE